MSRKLTLLIVGLIGSLAVVAGGTQGCSSGSSSGDNVALCQKACDKALECTPDAGTAGTQAAAQCKQNCTTQVPTTHCTNEAAIASAVNACLSMSCDAFINCLGTVPDCVSTTGTAGTGGGGTGGGAGTSGGGWTCEDQPAQGSNPSICVCINGAGGTLTSCPSSETCCFTADLGGTAACTCTTVPAGVTCAQLVTAASGTMVSHCP